MFKFVGLMPLVPSLIIFGAGSCLLFYGKKNKSSALRIGGWVMTFGAAIIMIGSLYLFLQGRGEGHPMMNHGGCPMMEMMQGHGGGMGRGDCACMDRPMMPPPAPQQPMMPRKM